MKRFINRIVIPLLALAVFYFFIGKNPQFNPPASIQSSPTKVIPAPTSQPVSEQDQTLYPVTKVVDGDTVHVLIAGKNETVRLIGIDTPEVVDPRKPVQCFGKEASDKAKEVLTGKKVRLETDPSQGDLDKYQRKLVYVFLEDGTNFNKFMIEQGFAHEYTYDLPYKYQAEFKGAEQQAESQKKGLWGDGVCPQ